MTILIGVLFFLIGGILGFVIRDKYHHKKALADLRHRFDGCLFIKNTDRSDIFPTTFPEVCRHVVTQTPKEEQWVFQELDRLINEGTLRVHVEDDKRVYYRVMQI